MTFTAFCKHGDFDAAKAAAAEAGGLAEKTETGDMGGGGDTGDGGAGSDDNGSGGGDGAGLSIDGLVYNIQIQLPESRDPKVYDALFQSLAKHLRP